MRQRRQMTGTHGRSVTRRDFVAGTTVSGFSVSLLRPNDVQTDTSGPKIRLGIIGCGGRGTWITALFRKHGGYEIVAAYDYFQDRVDTFGDKYQIEASRRYSGLSGYKRLLEGKVDAVAIESPPYFHPEQAAAAVDAGVHVYLAKPIAVDVPGCHSVAESGAQATAKKLCFLVDFQTRSQPLFQEAIRRVHEGAIGEFAFGEASYHAENPFEEQYQFLQTDPENPENRLRAWGLDRALSGDIITEQNIHTLDVASWIMNQPPVFAVGTGGLTARRRLGTCWDHFVVLFQYPGQLGMAFSSRQFNGHGTQPEGIRNRVFGSKGVLETQYGGQVLIRGENFFRGGSTSAIYEEGAAHNIAAFHKSMVGGDFQNPTVTPSVHSNLLTILGRNAAYTGHQVYWADLVKSTERLDARLTGLKD